MDISSHGSESGLGVKFDPISGDGEILAADFHGFVTNQDAGIEVKNGLGEFNENFPILVIMGFEFQVGERHIRLVVFLRRIGLQNQLKFPLRIVVWNFDSIDGNSHRNGQVQLLFGGSWRGFRRRLCPQRKKREAECEQENLRRQFHGGRGVV